MKVGVIDTGVDYFHPDIEGAYMGGYDSFQKDDDPYEEPPLTLEEDLLGTGYEGTYHGTHVAGTIIGQFRNHSSEIVQKGVAYGAELYAYKVLGRNPDDPTTSSGSSAQVIDGIEHAVKDGMDVINLSLGSDAEKDVNSPDSIAINNAVLAGVTAVIANGNAGPGYSTMGSPAAAQLGISVGAVTSDSKNFSGKFDPITNTGDSVVDATYATYGEFHMMGWEPTHEDFNSIFGDSAYQLVYAGLGAENDYKNIGDVTDKIVFVSRGTLTFVDKIAIAKKHGAKAIILYNGRANGTAPDFTPDISPLLDGYISVDPVNLTPYVLGDSYDYIPTLNMKGYEGRRLADLIANKGQSVSIKFDSTMYESWITYGDEPADFTSWGPNFDSAMSIKPDISAPGVNIMSTWPAYKKYLSNAAYDKAYNRISGTSMATPHAAGLALLIKDAHRNYTPFDIRAALANTADPIEAAGDYYISGPGRANVMNAILTPALLTAVEPITILNKDFSPMAVTNYNPTASFGLVAPGSTPSQTLELKNTSDQSLTYQASVEWLPNTGDINPTADVRETITVDPGQKTNFDLTLSVGENVPTDSWYEGSVVLKADGVPTLRLPFVVHVGDTPIPLTEIDQVSLTDKVLYPNRNYQKTTDLSFRLNSPDTNYIEVDVVNLDDETIGIWDSKNTAKITDLFPMDAYSLPGFDGTYYPVDSEGNFILDKNGEPSQASLTDGVYKLVIIAAQLTADGKVAVDKYKQSILYQNVTSFRVDISVPYSGIGAIPATPTTSAAAAAVVDQGLKQVPVTPSASNKDGIATVSVTDDSLKSAIASAGTSPAAVLIDGGKEPNSKLTLTADQVKLLGSLSAKSTVVFSVYGSAAALPVALFTGAPAGAALDVAVKSAEDAKASFTAKLGDGKLVGTPVSFEANWVTAAGSKPVAAPSNVFIKRSFTVPGSIEPNTAGVLYEEGGVVTAVSSVFAKQTDGTTVVTVSRPGFSVYAAATRTVAFTDIAASVQASHIQALANKWIINGTTATTFSPKANLTRAEFTALLVRALGLKASGTVAFKDVKSSDWFAADVAAASEAGLIKGIGGGKFAPNDKVTREDLAVILDRALKLTGIELKPIGQNPIVPYKDDASVSSYAKDSVKALSDSGILSGFTLPGGTFYRPAAAATREFAAAALHELLVKAGLTD